TPVRGDHDAAHPRSIRLRAARIRDPRTQARPRNVAAVRRGRMTRAGSQKLRLRYLIPTICWNGVVKASNGAAPVDKQKARGIYTRSTARRPPRGVMARLRSSSLMLGGPASDLIGSVGFDGSPGLPGEGTAWSRAVCQVNRKKQKRGRRGPCGPPPRERARPDETSAVHVSGHTMGRESDRKVTDLVKRCDQPVQVLIQPESLILAQSERWRQA